MTATVQAYKSLSAFQSNIKNFKQSRITPSIRDWDLPRARSFKEKDGWQTGWTQSEELMQTQ